MRHATPTFHEDPAGLFADVKLEGADFTRLRVSTQAERRALLAAVRRALERSTRGLVHQRTQCAAVTSGSSA